MGLRNVLLLALVVLRVHSAYGINNTSTISSFVVDSWSRLNWKQVTILDDSLPPKLMPLVLRQAGEAGISVTYDSSGQFLKGFNKGKLKYFFYYNHKYNNLTMSILLF